MSDTAVLLWVGYGIGYAVSLAYSIARWDLSDDPSLIIPTAMFAIFWPLIVPVYVPYRFFLWLGVKPE